LPPDVDVALALRPIPSPTPLVHVEVGVAHPPAGAASWHIVRGAPERIARAAAKDAAGDVPIEVASAPPGVDLRLGRPARGPVVVAYDVLAGDDAPDDPLGIYVVDDRFRAAGERLVALPPLVDAARVAVLAHIDGEALRAPAAASSLGVGSVRRATLAPEALRYATFVAGSLGVQVIDDPGSGHDEGSWLGYTAFDPRPTVAELAQVRSALRELLHSGVDPGAWTYLFVSQTRPIGSFSTTPRLGSVLLQVGPGEPWSAGLRLSVAQQLARRWVGGEVRIATEPGHEAEAWWFSEGVSRYVAMSLLARLKLLTLDEVRDAVAGELSVAATSPHRALANDRLAELATKDETARATLMARGALYALREAAILRSRTKGERDLVGVVADLVKRAEEKKEGAVPLSAWLETVGKDDPDAGRAFEAAILRGGPIALPEGALGPCFRAGAGEYVAFDPGFDIDATRISKDGAVVGVRQGGPAAKVGLRDGDVVESMHANEGDASVPVKITVTRGTGADAKKITMTYPPRGAHGPGQTWTRSRHVPDDQCGPPP
jgi:hypothetical protein